jgi:hypothetical protein
MSDVLQIPADLTPLLRRVALSNSAVACLGAETPDEDEILAAADAIRHLHALVPA